MSILHAYHSKFPFRNVKGKPSITVSAKGISNGLSDTYNDGADFGPDTMLNATSPNQYGPPYTQTSGIQEAYNYGKIKYQNSNMNGDFTIVLSEGIFLLNADVNIVIGRSSTDLSNPSAVDIIGQGRTKTAVIVNQVGLNGIVISTTSNTATAVDNTTIQNLYMGVGFGFSPPYGSPLTNNIAQYPTGSGANSVLSYQLLGNGGQGTQLDLINVDIFSGSWNNGYGPTNGALYVWGGINIEAFGSTFYGDRALALIGSSNAGSGTSQYYDPFLTATFNGCFLSAGNGNQYIVGYLINIQGSDIGGNTNLNYNSSTTGLTTNMTIEGSTIWGQFDLTDATVNFIKLSEVNYMGPQGNVYNAIFGSGAPVNVNQLEMKNISYFGNSYYGTFANLVYNVNFSEYDIHGFNNINGNAITLPTQSTTSGTTAGTVKMDAVIYRTSYKKYVITFSGYENDTTTNQTINFPLPFSTSAVISANNTGLTVSTTTTGITITSPNSTATFSGIVIVEGY